MNKCMTGFAVGATLLGLACASSPAPTEQLAAAESSLRAAQEIGAQRVPRAELYMRLAREQVAQARKLTDNGDNERAAMVLTRARADAELAIAISRESAAHSDLEAATGQPSADTAQPDGSARAAR
jgi:hypothetical protein